MKDLDFELDNLIDEDIMYGGEHEKGSANMFVNAGLVVLGLALGVGGSMLVARLRGSKAQHTDASGNPLLPQEIILQQGVYSSGGQVQSAIKQTIKMPDGSEKVIFQDGTSMIIPPELPMV